VKKELFSKKKYELIQLKMNLCSSKSIGRFCMANRPKTDIGFFGNATVNTLSRVRTLIKIRSKIKFDIFSIENLSKFNFD
jgi:hypothetical protein